MKTLKVKSFTDQYKQNECYSDDSGFDLYVTEPRANEWDIAAGHAIVKNAGGIITDFENKEILYGKKDFKNPSIILKRSETL